MPSHSATAFGSVGIESTRQNRSNLETIGPTSRRRFSPARRPALHMFPMTATSTWKPTLKSVERSTRTDYRCDLDFVLLRPRPVGETANHSEHQAEPSLAAPASCPTLLTDISRHHDNLAHRSRPPNVQRKAMPTQFLHSIRKSETVNCWRCKTRQYPRNGACVRCHCALKLEYLNLEVVPCSILVRLMTRGSLPAQSASCSGACARAAA